MEKTSWPAEQVEKRKVSDLTPYARNARTHSDEQVAQIAASIKEWGVTCRWAFCKENDCYVATENGDVFRVCRRQKTKSGSLAEVYKTVLLKGSLDCYGYRVYRMVVEGKKRHVKGHRIVAGAFMDYGLDVQVNHVDGVKTNNDLQNLEWVTAAQNQRHAIETGLKNPYKMNTKNQKVPYWEWTSIHAMATHLGVSRAEIARQNGVCRQTIDALIAKVDKIMVSQC